MVDNNNKETFEKIFSKINKDMDNLEINSNREIKDLLNLSKEVNEIASRIINLKIK
jgi:hypothetical protein